MSLSKSTKGLPIPRWLWNRFRVWQRRARLDDWDLVIEFRAKTYKNRWLTNNVPGYKQASIFVPKADYDELGSAEADRKICHELFHVFNAPSSDRLGKLVGFASYVYDEMGDQEELRADAFADVLTRAYARKQEGR